ncbi:MAG: T9SS type A sorting domain-containing protein [Bacteroidetes bacterium]|nr:T9SS type A sorting domain-containing protein [Bacteroidota bacterium]
MNKVLLFAFALFIFSSEKISAQLSAATSSTNPTCANNNGSAAVTSSGGNGYTYKWSNGATTATVNSLAAGTYTVTVYSSAGTIWDTLYLETFDAAQTWTLNISTGTNGADPNFWTISDNEGGVTPSGCGVANNGNATLHLTSVFNPTGGAAYDAGGLCGLLFCPQTSAAAQSANINTNGANNLVLSYDFIGAGQGLTDNASSLYSINGGGAFTSLDPALKSVNTGCGGQGKWTKRSYNLPISCNNISSFMVRFNWVNDDDGAGTDPSVAINNVLLRDSMPGTADSIVKTVTLSQPTPPHFVTAALSVINPSCGVNNGSINNVGVAGGTPNYTYSWTVSGAQIGTANSITNIGAGTYTFEATDQNGCVIDTSFTLVSTGTGSATVSTNDSLICASDSTVICTQGNYVSYLWNNGATTQCITAHNAGNYYVTATDGNNCSAISNHLSIFVYPLPPVSVSVNGDTLISHNGNSYQWYRNGNLIPNATDSVYIATQSGNYTVTLTDEHGCYVSSNGIPVNISGIAETEISDFGFRIFPNPATENLNVVVENKLVGKQISISDLSGRVLLNEKITTTNLKLEISHFPNGIYILKVGSVVKRVTKQ